MSRNEQFIHNNTNSEHEQRRSILYPVPLENHELCCMKWKSIPDLDELEIDQNNQNNKNRHKKCSDDETGKQSKIKRDDE